MARYRFVALLAPALLLGCKTTLHAPPSTAASSPARADEASATATGVHPDVASLAWIVGSWTSPSGLVSETWTPAGDALFGVSFEMTPDGKTKAWEVMIIRRDETGLVFAAMPGGRAETVFRIAESGPTSVTFTNPTHEFPKSVRYARWSDGAGDHLDARIFDETRGIDFPYFATRGARAAELEAADGRFAAETASRGADGWADAFLPEGAMGRPGGRIEGPEAIRAAMRIALAPGHKLEWAPIASGLSPAGDLGFTVGPWRALAEGPGGLAPSGRGAYVSVWKRGQDGAWRVLFDVGDPEPLAAGNTR